MLMEAFYYTVSIIALVAVIFFALVPVLEKWSKDSRREEEEHQNKFNQYEDDWIKIHRD